MQGKCNTEGKNVRSSSNSSSATGNDDRKSSKLCNSCSICIPTTFIIIIVVKTNDRASCRGLFLRIVQTATCPLKKLWRLLCAVLCCVLLIKVAGKLHKVIMRSYSCCPTYDGINILDRVEKGHGSLNQHVYPARYKVVQRSFQHSWSIILVGWIQMDWEEGDHFSWIRWIALDSSGF